MDIIDDPREGKKWMMDLLQEYGTISRKLSQKSTPERPQLTAIG
jgi:hypothetical protein